MIDANQYFSSWGSFLASLFVLVSIGKEKKISAARDAWAKRWLWLVFASLVVLASASRMFNDARCQENTNSFVESFVRGAVGHDELCQELKIGISLSAISGVFAIAMVILTHCLPKKTPIAIIGAVAGVIALSIWSINPPT